MDFFRRLRDQVAEIWAGMTPTARAAVAGMVVLCVGLVGAVVLWSGQTEYRVLLSGLIAEDAAAVTAGLDAKAIPYRLEAAGTTVLVPADRVAQANIALAAEGVTTKSGKGFELFDQTTLGMTPFTQHVNYLRALQAELARTIMQIDPVVSARVHIVRPEPSPFVRDQKAPTASVFLRLRPGAVLARSTANGIAALVARSVEGLTPEHVTILDARGRVLSESGGPEAGAVSSQLDYRRSLEQYLASKAEDMLARVLGPGRAIVKVAADVNFQRLKERKETYDPRGKVAIDEKTTTSKSTTTAPAPRGPAGTASNLPGRPGGGQQGGGGASNTQEEVTETRFAVSKTVQELEDKLGTIDRLTVAVLVDLSKQTGPTLTVTDIQELTKQALGFRPARDEIKITEVRIADPAPTTAEDEAVQSWQQWQFIVQLVRHGSVGLAAVVVLLLGLLLVRRLRPVQPPVPAPDRTRRVERLERVARDNPDALARALATWLTRSRGTAT